MTPGPTSLLHTILAADNFPSDPYGDPFPARHPTTVEEYIPFHLSESDCTANLPPVGLIRPCVAHEMESYDFTSTAHRVPPWPDSPWRIHRESTVDSGPDLTGRIDHITFADWVADGGREVMSRIMQGLAETWKKNGKFAESLSGESDRVSVLRV